MEGVVLYVVLKIVFVQGKERRYMVLFTVLSYGTYSARKAMEV